MALELVLVRHAKSSWSDLSLRDHDRPLNERGERNAPMMAARFADALAGLDDTTFVLSSTAVRARVTAHAFASALGTPVALESRLYMASASEIWRYSLGTFGSADSNVRRVLVVAHHPGISELAELLSAGEITHMVTCAVARFVWDADALADFPVLADRWNVDTPR